MKRNYWRNMLATLAVAGLVGSAFSAPAQNTPAVSTAAASEPVPQLAYGVPQILQLAQAKISDGTIIAYIKSSGISYGLNASQIIYLRQQGISDAVITAMLGRLPTASPGPGLHPVHPGPGLCRPVGGGTRAGICSHGHPSPDRDLHPKRAGHHLLL